MLNPVMIAGGGRSKNDRSSQAVQCDVMPRVQVRDAWAFSCRCGVGVDNRSNISPFLTIESRTDWGL